MDQPRVSAGNPNGGQWTSKHGGWGRGASGYTYSSDSGEENLSEAAVAAYTESKWGVKRSRNEIAALAGAQVGSRVTITPHDPMYGIEANSLLVSIEFIGSDGFPIGSAYRAVGKTKIYNEELVLHKGFQGQGRGIEIFGQQVDQATKHGYRAIEAIAAGISPGQGGTKYDLNGYYTWARLGYDGEVQGPRGRTTIHELMKNPDDTAWWKQNGEQFYGIFSLAPGSESLRVFNEYRRLKGQV